MDAKPSGRLLTGHSSVGWPTLQLEINHLTSLEELGLQRRTQSTSTILSV
ncbi:hypothetical protein GRAN_5205 [Granulicella sibirica]|uniref:Uncharacterized protein n=1 Tax=Granulicella sibirica TaxID=2479048 RepID=A0A4Q0ST85_9BACT|nr:hypothetical protein GRAN_5205 [Granulicella sibirica]